MAGLSALAAWYGAQVGTTVNQIVEITLGREGLDYVRECLSIGKALSHAFLATVDLAAGVLTTFLPSGVPHAEIVRFWSGGKMEEELGPGPTFFSSIEAHVASDPHAFCVLEDQMGSPRDPWLADLPAPTLTDGQSLYYLLTVARTDADARQRTFNRAMSIRPPLIGFLGRGPAVAVFDRRHVPSDDPAFRDLAAGTDQILMGAYDGESFVRWQRASIDDAPI